MINIEKKDKINIVTFKTDTINALITDEIRDQIIKIFEASNAKVIIDLSGVRYIDSMGFASFLSIRKTARNNFGTLKFVNPSPSVMEVLRILHLNTELDIYEDLDECIRDMKIKSCRLRIRQSAEPQFTRPFQ